MKKTILLSALVLYLFCITTPIFALDFWPDGGFAGLGAEINGYSRKGLSFGGNLMLGIDLNDSFSAGLKTGFFDNFDTVSAFETALFFRYYLPWLHIPKSMDGPFAQLEAGSVVLFERGYHEYPEAFPSFTGGLSAGWRFNFGEHWYVEPAARAGYPHIWGFSVTAGIRFKTQKTVVSEQIKEADKKDTVQIAEKEEETIEEPKIEIIIEEPEDETIKQASEKIDESEFQVFPVIFRANHADFEGLNPETIKNNNEAVRQIAEFLNEHENYKVTIVGYANPTTPEGRDRERERNTLIRLSEQRALKVMEELGKLGVSYSRMTVSGMGFSKIAAPYNDKNNNWKNRRVEFILYMEKGGIE